MSASAVIPSISIDALLAARDAVQAAFRDSRRLLDDAQEQLRPFGVEMPSVEVKFAHDDYAKLQDPLYSDAIQEEIDRHVWVRLLTLTHVDTIMDHKTRGEFLERLGVSRSRRFGNKPDDLPPLTRENVEATIRSIHGQQEAFFEKCIEQVYRSLSWEHRTNEPTRIGEKLIVTGAFYQHQRSLQGNTVSLLRDDSLRDLERVLCLLDGQPPPTGGVGLRSLREIPWGAWVDVPSPAGPPLMRLKVFRIGTTHVRILNRKHVDEMNLRMARRFPGAIAPPQEDAAATKRAEPRRPTAVSLAKTEKAARQAFYTPAEVADLLVAAAAKALGSRPRYDGTPDLGGHLRALEPSAGEGAIVRALLRARCEHVVAIENDPHGVRMLGLLADRVNEQRPDTDLALCVLPGDFFDRVCVQPGIFELVAMNPPFANAQDVEHVLHAWGFVKPGGVLVSVMSAGAATRTSGRYAVLRKFLDSNSAEVTPLPAGAFEESGTGVSTVMVVVRKSKPAT